MVFKNIKHRVQAWRDLRSQRKLRPGPAPRTRPKSVRFDSKITGSGSYLPEKKLSNQELEKMLDTSDAWIIERTGIESRHINAPDQATSDLAFHASLAALSSARLQPHEIDAIIVATVTPDQPVPSVACFLQSRLECRPILAFDVNAACSGFLYALRVANDLIGGGDFKNILVVGADTLSRITNYKDRSSCILFGDGAGAVVLSRSQHADENLRGKTGHARFFATNTISQGALAPILQIKAGGSRRLPQGQAFAPEDYFMSMDGRSVFKAAVQYMKQSCLDVVDRSGLKFSDIDNVLIHQANLRIIDSLANQLDISRDKFLCNIQQTGNTSSASIPILMDQNIRTGVIKRGHTLLLGAFGAGVTSAAILLEY